MTPQERLDLVDQIEREILTFAARMKELNPQGTIDVPVRVARTPEEMLQDGKNTKKLSVRQEPDAITLRISQIEEQTLKLAVYWKGWCRNIVEEANVELGVK